MILHIGKNNVVFLSSIVAIIDKELMLSSSTNREVLSSAQKEKRLISFNDDTVSYVITQEKYKPVLIYCSPISCATLAKRCNSSSSLKVFSPNKEN